MGITPITKYSPFGFKLILSDLSELCATARPLAPFYLNVFNFFFVFKPLSAPRNSQLTLMPLAKWMTDTSLDVFETISGFIGLETFLSQFCFRISMINSWWNQTLTSTQFNNNFSLLSKIGLFAIEDSWQDQKRLDIKWINRPNRPRNHQLAALGSSSTVEDERSLGQQTAAKLVD